MHYPKLNTKRQTRQLIDTFGGYHHRLQIADGEFYDTKNLTVKHYPMFASRDRRATVNRSFTRLQAIIAKDALYWVDNGTLYANGYQTGLTGLQTEHETQLVSMGAYICVFPDKKYINTMDLSDYGDMGASYLSPANATVLARMCHRDGTVYETITKGDTEPEEPANGDVWIDTSNGTTAREWSVYTETWTVIETVYVRLDFRTMRDIPTRFKEYDGVNISGTPWDDINGSKILYAVGSESGESYDYVVVIGEPDTNRAAAGTGVRVSIERTVPDMDYVCEAQNRLWGCYYGNDGTQNINEVYCCALGDFRNWEQYLGVSTDSWRASRGSDGVWTGCINYLGTPTFFKENVIHPITVSSVGAHQIGDIPARGVQEGSWRSLAVVNETLYYKARAGVMAYQGGMPAEVGDALGEVRYYEAAAGAFGNQYYISMRDEENAWHLFCFDVQKGLWMHEDDLHAEMFDRWGDSLYALAGNRIVDLNGVDGTKEDRVLWSAETGIIHYEQSVSGYGRQQIRYISRFNLRLNMALDASMHVYVEYDSSGLWQPIGNIRLPQTGTVTVPVRPRRCDHMRLRFEGQGEVRMFSIAKLLERGSDV